MKAHYWHLAVMAVLMYVAMYWLMYAMVDQLDNVVSNVNQFYMAGLMTAVMIPIELSVMRSMYKDRKANWAILAVSLIAAVGFWLGIRQQLTIGDDQLLRSMIPHHGGAILMCEQASLSDSSVQELCGQIIASQQSEIALMRDMLGEAE
ncbi:MAG TPA: DUF305 domain-containing protein [Acidimicrobiia bacterium]|nr:DUF305 domain-containing protein [Acidimicrobiia bacterium]